MKGGKHVDEAVERVREVLKLDGGGKREEDPGDDEDKEGEQNLKCFGSCLGLRGGAAGGRCLESAETLVGDGESGGEDQGEFVGSDAEKTLADDESADLGAGRLRRADDVMGKVGGASDQKVDVDVERA